MNDHLKEPQNGRINSMYDMFQNMANVQFQPLQRGCATSLSEFYDTVVLQNELDRAVVLRWWELLKRYCALENDQLIAFVRRYGNCRPRTNQRRGFFSKYTNGPSYFFCDNSVADYFYAMAKEGFVPQYDDFVRFISDRQFPCAVRCTREEYARDAQGNLLFQAYTYQANSKPTGLYLQYQSSDGRRRENKQWYMAHILDVDNPADYCHECHYGERSDEIFLQGDRDDWFRRNGGTYPYRDMGKELSHRDREILVAHFLRLVNPMNYFLTPQTHGQMVNNHRRRIQTLVVGGREFRLGIQELPEMKSFMRVKRIQRYGDAFMEYERLAMAVQRNVDITLTNADKEINLRYCPPNEELDGTNVRIEAHHIQVRQRRAILNTHGTPVILLNPVDTEEFKRMLLLRHRVNRICVYADGRRNVDVWHAENFTERSDLMNNIRSSGVYRSAARNGVIRLEFNFDGIN